MIGYVLGLMEQERDLYANYALPFIRNKVHVTEVSVIGDTEGLATQYNRGVMKLISQWGAEMQIIVFCHPDVIFRDALFESTLESAFRQDPSVGICGVCGSVVLPANSNWWSSDECQLRGQVIQEHEAGPPTHEVFGTKGYFDDLICVDGFCFAVRASLFQEGLKFDEKFPNYLHTDIDICFSAIRRGYKIAVVDTILQHRSEGWRADTTAWVDARELLFQKWRRTPMSDLLITREELIAPNDERSC